MEFEKLSRWIFLFEPETAERAIKALGKRFTGKFKFAREIYSTKDENG